MNPIPENDAASVAQATQRRQPAPQPENKASDPRNAALEKARSIINQSTTAPTLEQPQNKAPQSNASAKKNSNDSASSRPALKADDNALHWERIVDQLRITGLPMQLALHCCLNGHDDQQMRLTLAKSNEHLLSEARLTALQKALQEQMQKAFKVSIDVAATNGLTPAALNAQRQAEKQQRAEAEIYNDQTVKALINAFGAKVNPNSITPVD
jgi:DNA polymerase-3 subunit gamma/tau